MDHVKKLRPRQKKENVFLIKKACTWKSYTLHIFKSYTDLTILIYIPYINEIQRSYTPAIKHWIEQINRFCWIQQFLTEINIPLKLHSNPTQKIKIYKKDCYIQD